MDISIEARSFIGLMMVTIPTIEFGGAFLLSMLRRQSGYAESGVVRHYFRAGHAHAGVLLILAMLAQLVIDAAAFSPALGYAVRIGFALPPILFAVGYFLGAPGADGKPKPLLAAVYVGGILLALSTVTLGIALLAGAR